ncbi:hypothetical protein GUJ93_ZPchr0013g36088 [Zizania palustris]|uniref:Uncharacterized protein n=1 Tax=Zizania palustris TaxID=103762 RepID=A0A8J5WVX0_ZIZPA|nr:hypothetical protein GUJ93_ZPchr0013g36088 [Zizania palustris]
MGINNKQTERAAGSRLHLLTHPSHAPSSLYLTFLVRRRLVPLLRRHKMTMLTAPVVAVVLLLTWAADLLARMTLAEKIGQMTQIERQVASPQVLKDNFIGEHIVLLLTWPAAMAAAAGACE